MAKINANARRHWSCGRYRGRRGRDRFERPQGPVGAFELLGVVVALVLDQRELANPFVRLAQPAVREGTR